MLGITWLVLTNQRALFQSRVLVLWLKLSLSRECTVICARTYHSRDEGPWAQATPQPPLGLKWGVKMRKTSQLRFVYITTKMRRFCIRLAGFMNLIFSLKTRKRRVFIVNVNEPLDDGLMVKLLGYLNSGWAILVLLKEISVPVKAKVWKERH